MKVRASAVPLGLAVFLAVSACMSSALAQPADAAKKDEAKAKKEDVEKVVVTAQKRSEALQDVPMSVSVFSRGAIENRGIDSVADVASQLPGVKFGEFSATGTISMRGVGTTIVSGAGENSVATHIDGMFLSQPAALTMIQQDIGSIEVLRGPQGTLYGRNATGGVINFISAKPTDDFHYSVTLGAGNYERRYAKGFVSGPISDTARVRLSLQADDRDGYARNVTTGQSLEDLTGLGGRLSLDVDMSETWSLEARVFAQRDDFAGPVYDGFYAGFTIVPPPLTDLDPRRVASSTIYDSSKDLYGAVITNTFDVGFASLKSITGYTDFTYDGKFDGIGAVLSVPLDRTLGARTFSEELNLQGETDRLDWLVGVFYMLDDVEARSLTDFTGLFGIPSNLTVEQSSTRESISAFADVTLKLADRWSAFGGARVLSENLKQDLTTVNTTLGISTTLCSPATVPQDMDDSTVTGRLGLKFDATDDAMLYGQAAWGYKPGGFSQSNCNNPYEAETVDALEIGFHTIWRDARLTFNAAAFYYDNTNLQLEQATPAGIPVVNAPESHVLGAEAEVFWQPVDGLRINAALTLLDSQYDRFINQDPLLGAPPGISLKGVPLNNAPSYSASLGAEYAFGLAEAGTLTLRGEAYITDKYNVREFNLPWTVQDGYTQFSAFAIWDSSSEHYQVRAFVKNATDEDVLGGVLGFGGAIGSFLPPRTFGIEFKLRN